MADDFNLTDFQQPDFETEHFVNPIPVRIRFSVGDTITGEVSGHLTNDYKNFKYIGRDGNTYHLPMEARDYGY